MKQPNNMMRKKIYTILQRLAGAVCIFTLLLLSGVACPLGAAQNGPSAERYVTIDFHDVDINLFIKYISELTGHNFVVDRAVKGKVTIISPTRISEQDAYRVFESVLEVHGFTTVPAGSITKIVPSVQARSKSIETIRKEGAQYPSDKVVTQIIPLKYSDPVELKKILAPLVSKTSVIIAHSESGMLIITDVLSNIDRLLEIINAVDVPSVGEELAIMPLQHASAANISKSLTQLFARTTAKNTRTRETVRVIPYERTNTLIVFAPATQIQKIRNLLVQLDSEVPRGAGNIQVYYLQHASAEELVKVLTNLPEKTNAQAKGKAPVISKDVQVMADPETNAIIITAPRDEYLVLENVIKQLDIPRRMVYLEALIMEVSADRSFELGVQWGGGGSFDNETGSLVTGFSGSKTDPFNILEGATSDPAVLPAGFTLGVMREGVKIGNVLFPNLGAVVNAYKDDSDINIVATPQILTTDNKKASIKVGENVPYITSKNTTSGTQQDYTNYEYKDVATTLEITPQVNQQDVVRMEILTEVIKLKTASETPTTFTRKAETTVVVHDRETVVIGGIVGQDNDSSDYKVPLLGDIPILGWLFKTRAERERRTNLFIFITPHIVENPAELAELYYKKRDVMEYVQKGSSAIPDYKFKSEPNPQHAIALSDLGFAKLQKNDYLRARQYFEQALKIDPNNPHALINMGVIYEHDGDLQKAAEMYQRVIDQPVDPQAPAISTENELLQDVARNNLENLPQPDENTTEN